MDLILRGTRRVETFNNENPVESRAYVVFSVIVCIGALMLLDKRERLVFSSLMTFSVAVQCLGYYFLLMHVIRGGTRSVSMQTLGLQVIAFIFRLYVICFYEGYHRCLFDPFRIK